MRAALRQAQGGRVYLRYVANQARRRGPKPPPRHGPSDKVEPLPTIALPPILAEARTRWDGGRIGSLQARRGAGLATPYSRFERLTSRMPPALPGGVTDPKGDSQGIAATPQAAVQGSHGGSGLYAAPRRCQPARGLHHIRDLPRGSKGLKGAPGSTRSWVLARLTRTMLRRNDIWMTKRCLPRWRPITAASTIPFRCKMQRSHHHRHQICL